MCPSRLAFLAVPPLVLLATAPAWGCPPLGYHDGGFSPFWLALPLFFIVALPSAILQALAPPMVPWAKRRGTWPLAAWATVLGAFLLLTGAGRDWRRYGRRVAEAVRTSVMVDGATPAYRKLAQEAPWVFWSTPALASTLASVAVVAMWVWTLVTPDVTWGTGLEVPLTFTADTVLTWVAVRWLVARIAPHVGLALTAPASVARGAQAVLRAGFLGGVAGWVWGALFGLSSGVQTYFLMGHTKTDVIPLLAGWYAAHAGLIGVGVGAVVVAALAWAAPRAKPAQGA
jgi:hypothetical protein